MRSSLAADLVANTADPLERAVKANELVRYLTETYRQELAEAYQLRADAIAAAQLAGVTLTVIGRAMDPPVTRQRAYLMRYGR